MTPSGFLVINKSVGVSSHAVVNRVRKLTGQKKAGHTGTLDPFATGVLPVALGDATKFIQFLDESLKEYRAVMRLGESTDTQDCTGNILCQRDWQHISADLIHAVAREFIGPLLQLPPMYSAIKQNGVPLYRIARNGGEVTREPRGIVIHSLTVESIDLPEVTFSVKCSRGTYVRTLANDMGERLGCGAHLVSLCRTRSGPFLLESSVTVEQLEEALGHGGLNSLLLTPETLISDMGVLELNETATKRLMHGVAPVRSGIECGKWPEKGERVLLKGNGLLMAAAEAVSDDSLHLLRVFV